MKLEYSLNQIQSIAKKILLDFPKHRVFLLKGNLGAGKTSLVKAFLESLGNSQEVSSPTYSLIQEYPGKTDKIYHIDLYRARTEDEIFDLGIWEYFEGGNYLFIEWPEKLEPYIQDPYLEIKLEVLEAEMRSLETQEK